VQDYNCIVRIRTVNLFANYAFLSPSGAPRTVHFRRETSTSASMET